MKALVTGGAGFIGSNLVESLVDNCEVTVLDNFHTGSKGNLATVSKDITVIKGSCNGCLNFGLEPEVIFHLGIPSSSPMYKKDSFLVGEAVNGMVAKHVTDIAVKELNRAGKVIRDSKVLVMGLTYKENVPDTPREPGGGDGI